MTDSRRSDHSLVDVVPGVTTDAWDLPPGRWRRLSKHSSPLAPLVLALDDPPLTCPPGAMLVRSGNGRVRAAGAVICMELPQTCIDFVTRRARGVQYGQPKLEAFFTALARGVNEEGWLIDTPELLVIRTPLYIFVVEKTEGTVSAKPTAARRVEADGPSNTPSDRPNDSRSLSQATTALDALVRSPTRRVPIDEVAWKELAKWFRTTVPPIEPAGAGVYQLAQECVVQRLSGSAWSAPPKVVGLLLDDGLSRPLTPSESVDGFRSTIPYVPEIHARVRSQILDWARDTSSAAKLAVLSGTRGMGKTRLARAICLQLLREDWDTGFVSSRFVDEAMFLGVGAAPPRFLVIELDTFDTTRIGRLLHAVMTGTYPGPPALRVLILARDGRLGERLSHEYLGAAVGLFHLDPPASELLKLVGQAPELGAERIPEGDRERGTLTTPLEAVLAAVNLPQEVLTHWLEREAEHLYHSLIRASAAGRENLEFALRVLALVTLFGRTSHLREIIQHCARSLGAAQTLGVERALRASYGHGDSVVGLGLDLLARMFVDEQHARWPDLLRVAVEISQITLENVELMRLSLARLLFSNDPRAALCSMLGCSLADLGPILEGFGEFAIGATAKVLAIASELCTSDFTFITSSNSAARASELLSRMAYGMMRRNRFDLLEQLLLKAVEIDERIRKAGVFYPIMVRNYLDLADFYETERETSKMTRAVKRADGLMRLWSRSSPDDRAIFHICRAKLQLLRGHLQHALDEAIRAEALARNNDDLARALSVRRQIAARKGDSNALLRVLEQRAEVATHADVRAENHVLIASQYMERGQFAQAAEYYSRVIEHRAQYPNDHLAFISECDARIGRARAYDSCGQPGLALADFRRARDLLLEKASQGRGTDYELLTKVTEGIAITLIRLKDANGAIAEAHEAVRLSELSGKPAVQIEARANLASIAHECELREEARQALQAALTLHKIHGSPEDWITYANLLLIAASIEENSAAYRLSVGAVEALDRSDTLSWDAVRLRAAHVANCIDAGVSDEALEQARIAMRQAATCWVRSSEPSWNYALRVTLQVFHRACDAVSRPAEHELRALIASGDVWSTVALHALVEGSTFARLSELSRTDLAGANEQLFSMLWRAVCQSVLADS